MTIKYECHLFADHDIFVTEICEWTSIYVDGFGRIAVSHRKPSHWVYIGWCARMHGAVLCMRSQLEPIKTCWKCNSFQQLRNDFAIFYKAFSRSESIRKITSLQNDVLDKMNLLWKFVKPISFALIGKEVLFSKLDASLVGYGVLIVIVGSSVNIYLNIFSI